MVDDLQPLLDALASPIRREILWRLSDSELAVGEIAAAFDVTAPTISQHLSVLRRCGLVEMRVDGNFRRYRARRERLAGLEQLLQSPTRWEPADQLAEVGRTKVRDGLVVVADVEVAMTPELAFESFVDPERYSAWLGVPVSIVDGRFSCTLEWGTRVRGTYDLVAAPTLLAMRWDFDDDVVPVPGGERVAYLQVRPTRDGAAVEVHQFVENAQEAEFMRVAWAMVLGRFAEAAERDVAAEPRAKRPKFTR